MRAAAATELPPWIAFLVESGPFGGAAGPPQSLKEYDPEWGRAFWTGSVAASCRHDRMLASVKVPVLFTHHARVIDPSTGGLLGAISDLQLEHVRKLVTGAGLSLIHISEPTRLLSISY